MTIQTILGLTSEEILVLRAQNKVLPGRCNFCKTEVVNLPPDLEPHLCPHCWRKEVYTALAILEGVGQDNLSI